MLDLYPGTKPEEKGHFYLQPVEPVPHWLGWRWLVRLTWWTNIYKQDGSRAYFFSLVVLWFGHFYKGNSKCDGTRTVMARTGQLGEPRTVAPTCVMTDYPKEMLACRLRKQGMQAVPTWNNMGGC